MQIQLVFALFLFSLSAFAAPDSKEIKDLFARYDQVVAGQKVALKEVFTDKFIQEAGGEKSLKQGWEKAKPVKYELQIKESRRDQNLAYVKRVPAGSKEPPHSSFILVKKEGKWLIEGTLSDENN